MSDNIFTRIRQQHAAHEQQQHPSNAGSAALAASALGLNAGLTAPGLYPRLNPSGPFQAGKKKQEEEQPEGLIAEAVGIGGKNKAEDMEAVARHIMDRQIIKFNPFIYFRDREGYLGKVITAYQKGIGFKNPDGRIDPKGTTERNLLAGRKVEVPNFKQKAKTQGQKASKRPVSGPRKAPGELSEIPAILSPSQWYSQLAGSSRPAPLDEIKKRMSRKGKSASYYHNNGCFATCQYMLEKAGFSLDGSKKDALYTLAVEVHRKNDRFSSKSISGNGAEADLGYSELDRMLEAKIPVLVGVNKDTKAKSAINTHRDGGVSPTDHYIVIVGRGYRQGIFGYFYYDVGRSQESAGTGESNFLALGSTYLGGSVEGEFYGDAAYGSHDYILSEIRKTKAS